MAIKDAFIGEIKHEASLTRKMLERIPMEQNDWKPHEKSMSIGRLATHITETLRWLGEIQRSEEFDFLTWSGFQPRVASSSEELLNIFDQSLETAMKALEQMNDEDFEKIWQVKRGEVIAMKLPKKIAVRGWTISHHIHHRGQLSVYLRLLNLPVPGMYGPSADEH